MAAAAAADDDSRAGDMPPPVRCCGGRGAPPSERSLGWVVSRPLTSASVVRISLRFTLVSSPPVMPKSLHEFGRVGCLHETGSGGRQYTATRALWRLHTVCGLK